MLTSDLWEDIAATIHSQRLQELLTVDCVISMFHWLVVKTTLNHSFPSCKHLVALVQLADLNAL